MTLVYDNTTCKHAIFAYTFSEQNLDKSNIIFTVKKLVSKLNEKINKKI